MTDLYETLGVKKGASKAEIRRAYRKKAKDAHPDTQSGSTEKFTQLQIAHDILTDEERRAKYDATGDTSEKKIDNVISEAVQILSVMLDTVINKIDGRGGKFDEYDIIKDMKSMLEIKLDELATAKKNAEKQIDKYNKLIGKFKVKEGENFLESVIRQKISSCQTHLRSLEQQEIPGKKAWELLKLCTYDFTAPKPAGGTYGYLGGPPNMMQELLNQAMRGGI